MISIIKLLRYRISTVHWSLVIYFFSTMMSLKTEVWVLGHDLILANSYHRGLLSVHIDYNDILNLVPIFYLRVRALIIIIKYEIFQFFQTNNCQDKYLENKIQETGPDTRLILLTPQPTSMVSSHFWSSQSCYFLSYLTPNWLNKNCKN